MWTPEEYSYGDKSTEFIRVPLILLKTDGVSLEMLDIKFLACLIVYSQNRGKSFLGLAGR